MRPRLVLVVFFIIYILFSNYISATVYDNWYPGDTHIHTYYSDFDALYWNFLTGKQRFPKLSLPTVEDQARSAKRADLEWIIITDHEETTAPGIPIYGRRGLDEQDWFDLSEECVQAESAVGIKIMCGEEVGKCTPIFRQLQGHYLAYNIDRFIEWTGTPQEMIDEVNNSNNNQGFGFIAHPNTPLTDPLDWVDWNVVDYTGMAVMSKGIVPINEDTLNTWIQYLNLGKGNHNVGIGESDSHWDVRVENEVHPGDSVTFCYIEGELTHDAIYNALKKGRVVFSNGPLLYFTIDNYIIGDVIYFSSEKTLDISWNNRGFGEIDIIEIYTNKGLIKKIENVSGETETIQENIEISNDSIYIRLKAVFKERYYYIYEEDKYEVYTNPIWIKPIEWLYVDDDYPDSDDIDGDNDFKHIQAAINAANNGAVIIVSRGVYNENINFKGKAVTVKSIDPDNSNIVASTIIDGNQSGSVITFNNAEDANSVLNGFTIKKGKSITGGGIYCSSSSPIITNCTINNNWATQDRGGGIACWESSSPIITNCTINNNSGGGIYCSSSSSTITNCIINDNWAYDGGGIYCYKSSSLSITRCSIRGNSATNLGGGICCEESSPSIINCIISENMASLDGGGICCVSSSPIITNCTISQNFIITDIWVGVGGGISCIWGKGSSPTVKNCIFWKNFCNTLPYDIDCSEVNYCFTTFLRSGEGNISGNPLLFDLNGGNYHLYPNSPCIDAGDPNSTINEDKDGNPRPQDGNFDGVARCDIGAYEYFSISQGIISETNTIFQGATQTFNVFLDPSIFFAIFDARITVYRDRSRTVLQTNKESDIDLVLIKPDGTEINPSAADIDPNITFISGDNYKTYNISSPVSGEWQMVVTGTDVAPDGELINVSVKAVTDISLSLDFDKTEYLSGEQILAVAELQDTAGPITKALVEVNVQTPLGTDTLTLYDDGNRVYEVADDGIYANYYDNTDQKGSYIFKVNASGVSNNGDNFTRTITKTTVVDRDSDNDDMPDVWEDIYGLDKDRDDKEEDPDDDGLTNLEEYQYKTHPKRADTDDDGYNDSEEITKGSDPLDHVSIPVMSFEINLPAGWHMISLPVEPQDTTLSALFPKAEVVYGYEKGAGYVRVPNNRDLEVGKGYWILFYEDQNSVLTGQSIPSYADTVSEDGWSMIGGCSFDAKISTTGCKIGVIYKYALGSGYQRVPTSEVLKPCHGYWILFQDVVGQCQFRVEEDGD